MAVELNTGDSVELKRNIITIRPIVPRNSELWRFLISSMSAGDHLFWHYRCRLRNDETYRPTCTSNFVKISLTAAK